MTELPWILAEVRFGSPEQCLLRAINRPNYAFSFQDKTEYFRSDQGMRKVQANLDEDERVLKTLKKQEKKIVEKIEMIEQQQMQRRERLAETVV